MSMKIYKPNYEYMPEEWIQRERQKTKKCGVLQGRISFDEFLQKIELLNEYREECEQKRINSIYEFWYNIIDCRGMYYVLHNHIDHIQRPELDVSIMKELMHKYIKEVEVSKKITELIHTKFRHYYNNYSVYDSLLNLVFLNEEYIYKNMSYLFQVDEKYIVDNYEFFKILEVYLIDGDIFDKIEEFQVDEYIRKYFKKLYSWKHLKRKLQEYLFNIYE